MSQLNIIVLKDGEGNYYVLPREGVLQARVPDEYKGEIESLVGASSDELSDAQLEAVAGGALSIRQISAPSGLSGFNNFRSNWRTAGPTQSL